MKNHITNVTASAGTVAAGVSVWTDWIPQDIAKVSCVVGIVGMFFFMYKNWMDSRKTKLENILLQKQIDEKEKGLTEIQS